MKIRNGFVSNSSSSSFIAVGFSVKGVESASKDFMLEIGGITEEEYAAEIKAEQERYNMNYEDASREVFRDNIYGISEEYGIRYLCGGEGGVERDDVVIAVIVEETDSDGGDFYNSGTIEFKEENDFFAKAKYLRDKINPEAEIKVFYGSRSC